MPIDGKTPEEWDAIFAAENVAREAHRRGSEVGRSVANDALDLGETEDFSGYMENLSDALKEHMTNFTCADFDIAKSAFKARLAEAGIDPNLVH
jgi:hypothetical protein